MQLRGGSPEASNGPLASDAGRRRRFAVPLKPTVLVVFAAMTVPVLLGIVRVNYVSSDRVAHDYAADLVERFRRESIADILSEFAALKSLIGAAAELGRWFYSESGRSLSPHQPRQSGDDHEIAAD